MQPIVSVVLPFHNAAPWLGPALKSLHRQRDVQLEVIAVDDGSTDESYQIAERARGRGLPVRLIHHSSNQGIVHALNHGLDEASGRFIARMDADDICAPHRMIRQIQFMESCQVDLCGSWFVEFGQGVPRATRWPNTPSAVHAALLFQNPICHPTVMARREVFERFRYRPERQLAEDYDLFVRASAEFKLGNVPEVLLRYRRHAAQATQARRARMEEITQIIRGEALRLQRIEACPEEERIHNLIRAPSSIVDEQDLRLIELWLIKVISFFQDAEAQRVIASQWLRSCIRAAPLGRAMRDAFYGSQLRDYARLGRREDIDVYLLSLTRLDYNSTPFRFFRRLGLSS